MRNSSLPERAEYAFQRNRTGCPESERTACRTTPATVQEQRIPASSGARALRLILTRPDCGNWKTGLYFCQLLAREPSERGTKEKGLTHVQVLIGVVMDARCRVGTEHNRNCGRNCD